MIVEASIRLMLGFMYKKNGNQDLSLKCQTMSGKKNHKGMDTKNECILYLRT